MLPVPLNSGTSCIYCRIYARQTENLHYIIPGLRALREQ